MHGVMSKIIKITITISALFVIVNFAIHVLLYKYDFNYSSRLANISFIVCFATWLPALLISNDYQKRHKIDFLTLFQKNKKVTIPLAVIYCYSLIVFFLGSIKGVPLWISLLEPITPDKARVVSAGNMVLFYIPIWLLYLPYKEKK